MPRRAVVALLYVAAAMLVTWPLALSLTTHLGALQGPGDPYLNLWILGWGMHAWVTDPIGVLTGRLRRAFGGADLDQLQELRD